MEAWKSRIKPGELDAHMAAIEQAQANAEMVKAMFRDCPLENGARLLVHGCGTAQMFDYIKAADFGSGIKLTFADVSENMLKAARERLKAKGIAGELVEDDLENSSIRQGYDAVLLTLVLQHLLDYRKGVENMARLLPNAFYVIEQEQAPGTTPITLSRELPPTIREYGEKHPSRLVPRQELIAFMQEKGYLLNRVEERQVPDAKKMVGLVFKKT